MSATWSRSSARHVLLVGLNLLERADKIPWHVRVHAVSCFEVGALRVAMVEATIPEQDDLFGLAADLRELIAAAIVEASTRQ